MVSFHKDFIICFHVLLVARINYGKDIQICLDDSWWDDEYIPLFIFVAH